MQLRHAATDPDSSLSPSQVTWLIGLTPLILLLTHYAAVLPHEFAHSIVAWILGLKESPFNIDWGGDSLLNLLLLINIDENVDYSAALAAGKDWQVALVAFAGPGLANGSIYLLCRRFVLAPGTVSRPKVAYVLFWFLFMNLANLYDYVPIRVFAADGDVHHFILGTGISPWAVYVVGGYLVLWAIVDFYRKVLPAILQVCVGSIHYARAVVLVVATSLLFGYFAIPGFEEADDISLFMARTSVMAIPVVILMLWRRIIFTSPPPAS
jgi:hypothetical protein